MSRRPVRLLQVLLARVGIRWAFPVGNGAVQGHLSLQACQEGPITALHGSVGRLLREVAFPIAVATSAAPQPGGASSPSNRSVIRCWLHYR